MWVKWNIFITKAAVWLLLELILSLLGLDQLADYSEFVYSSSTHHLQGDELCLNTLLNAQFRELLI
jgi:hypothetical protein